MRKRTGIKAMRWLTGAILLISFRTFAQDSMTRREPVFKFDFGTGGAEEGFRKITSLDLYNEEKGYGFDLGSQAIALDRGTGDKINSDFCTGTSPLFFSVKVPEGNYKVTVTSGDAWFPAETTIKAESRRLMVKDLKTHRGEFKKVSFIVSVWDSIINQKEVVRLKPRERNKLDWDHKLTLEFNNQRPVINAIEIERVEHVKTIFLMGNSTVTNQQLEPWSCWGQMIPCFFDPDKIAVSNHAASGSTLRASKSRNRLKKVAGMLKPGDYLFIEFAHNDQKEGSGEEAYTTYNDLLEEYIDSARAHQAIPVLVTSTNRRSFDKQGKLRNTLGEFPDAMRYQGKKSGVAVIDLNKMTKTLYEAFGIEGSKRLFVQFPSGTFPGVDRTLQDNTHFSPFGAYELAKCMVQGIMDSGLDLKKYLRKEVSGFDPAQPDSFEKWDLPVTPMFTNVKPYGN